MIKKFSNIFLAIWLVILSSGFAVNQHFCGSDMAMAANKENAPSCHSPEGMEQSQNNHCQNEKSDSCNGFHPICCSEINRLFKNKVDHKSEYSFTLKILYTIAYSWMGSHAIQDFQHNFPFQNGYSPPVGQDVIILVQSFLL